MHRDALRLEEFGLANAGELQQLRRIERAAREDHLAARADFHNRPVAPALAIADADGTLTLKNQARRVHPGAHFEVRPLHHGMQKGAGGAHAAALEDRALGVVDAELTFAVVVRVARDAHLDRARDEGLAQRMMLVDVGDGQTAFTPAKGLVALPDAASPAA